MATDRIDEIRARLDEFGSRWNAEYPMQGMELMHRGATADVRYLLDALAAAQGLLREVCEARSWDGHATAISRIRAHLATAEAPPLNDEGDAP